MTEGFDLDAFGDTPRIAVVVRDHMSGVLYSVPSLRAIRKRWPKATITLLTSSYSAPILAGGCPYVDRILPLYSFADEPLRFDQARDLLRKLRTWLALVGRVDLVVHLRQVGGGTLAFSALLGRPAQVGYQQGRFDQLLTLDVGPQDVALGSRQRNRVILEAMGIEPDGDHMELWVDERDRRWAERWLAERGHVSGEHLTIVHPGSHWGCNQWLPERWTETIEQILDDRGGTVVVTGVHRELPLARRIVDGLDRVGSRVLIGAGETTLGRYAALVEASDLVVATDAVATQVCQALDKPAVIMMGAGDPSWNGPVAGEPMVMLQEWEDDDSRPELCEWAKGACNSDLCRSRLDGITVTQVVESIDRLTGSGRPS